MGKNDKKNKKGQTMSLHDFVGESSTAAEVDNNNWAQDGVFEDDTSASAVAARKTYGRQAGAMGNFRDDTNTAANSRIVDYNMERPYLGFVANLLTNLPEAEVREFFADADINIENIKMIYKERSTFAFVEFESPQHLQLALLLEGKFLKNRPVKVDIATQDQREKMMNDKARGMLSAGGAGQPKSPNSFPDRDAMGAEQRSFNSLGGDRRGPRSTTSANPPRDLSDFSRDTMGGAQPEGSNEFGIGARRTPNSNASGGFPNFNFRDGDRVEQPTLERRMPRQSSRDNVGKSDAKEPGSWRGSKAASPTTKAEAGSWRDAPKADQPQGSWRDEQPQRPKREDAPKKEEKKTLQLGGETQPQPKPEVPKPAAAPKSSAWGAGGGLAFRNVE